MTNTKDTLQVDDLNTFAHLLTQWHKKKVATLEHMAQVPEGTEVTLNDDTSPSITLTGSVLAGFKLGIELSLIELGELPFFTDVEDAPAAEPEATSA